MEIKPYRSIPIRECNEPLTDIPQNLFSFTSPHPYIALGAPYGATSPWMLRKSVLKSLIDAQNKLSQQRPGWTIKLFDAYRPNAVQAFMFARAMQEIAVKSGISLGATSDEQRDSIKKEASKFWGIPSEDPATPPPHSTGAAIDCTLCDENGNEIEMGSPIDEMSERSLPDYFARACDEIGKNAHANRSFLCQLMEAEGFSRLPQEWWHFSKGDQVSAWVGGKEFAIYGRAAHP